LTIPPQEGRSKPHRISSYWAYRISRHLTPFQAAPAEIEREALDSEYRAIVEKMKSEAADRKSEGGKLAGRRRPNAVICQKCGGLDYVDGQHRCRKHTQQIAEANRTNRETTTKRAKAAGTNRRYLQVATKLRQDELRFACWMMAASMTGRDGLP